MKVGDLVRHDQGFIGVIICIDPETIGDIVYTANVKVAWNDGDVCHMSVHDLEVISESR